MKRSKAPWLALFFFLLLMSSANPTNSQKGQQDSAPVVRPVPGVRDSVDTVPLPIAPSRLDSVAAKAERVEKVFDKVDKKSAKVSRALSNLEVRQLKTLHALIFSEPRTRVIIATIPPPKIGSNPDQPEIKPVEAHKPSWWRRTFKGEKK